MLYPQQNRLRHAVDISGLWRFQVDPDGVGEAQAWHDHLPAPRTIAVPGSWNEQFEDTRDYLGAAWYATEVQVPAAWHGHRVLIRVGSANYAARIWANGTEVGGHEGGHLPFVVDVTDHVHWDGPTRLAIRVENELLVTRVPPGAGPGGGMLGSFPATTYDFFPYAGIHRPVHLIAVPACHIDAVTVTTTLHGADGRVHVDVRTNVSWDGVGEVTLVDGARTFHVPVNIGGGHATAVVEVPDARPWCPEDPHLSTLTVRLFDGHGEATDAYALEVGIRTIEVQGDRLLLNGKPIFLKGFGKHEDFPIYGRGLALPVLVRDHALLRWVGANSYRTAHYPYADEALQLCDREGILVISEIPAVGLGFADPPDVIAARRERCEAQLDELIARDRNHPSVIMWSVANEPFPISFLRPVADDDPAAVAGATFLGGLIDRAHAADPSRPATVVALHDTPMSWLRLSDVVCINRYYGWYMQTGQTAEGAGKLAAELDAIHAELGRPMIVAEFGADTLPGHHAVPPEMFSEEYQVEFLRGYLDVADARPFVVGMHVWNFADFKTAQGVMRPGGMNHKGVFTRDRRPKMAAHFLRDRWGGR